MKSFAAAPAAPPARIAAGCGFRLDRAGPARLRAASRARVCGQVARLRDLSESARRIP
ncbi:MAG: hypothetical protein JNK30_18210 [Phenylobacterium sp.]|uniref:hypothetical protein n=1 Tax=Phenylobacterium sp. TaxID=1871053 RepID=UPI001A5B4165|nr:hypothetical protein [Phenylobacterium sp.]MBL8773323.1 hypothetical protein [Phenylobacterium sp.]